MEKERICISQIENGQFRRVTLCLKTLDGFINEYFITINDTKEIKNSDKVEYKIQRSKKSASLYLELRMKVLDDVHHKTIRFSNHHNKTSRRYKTNVIFDKCNLQPLDKNDEKLLKNTLDEALKK